MSAGSKVARVALAFWVMKLGATTLGKTFHDRLTRAPANGGLGFGTTGSLAVLAAILLTLLALTSHRDHCAAAAPVAAASPLP
jgi:uncharacterized membrane-anchored protein